MTLEDLLEEARRVGTVESVGHFTLDFQAAVDKLRGFQLENQYHYVNRLVRAAALAGAPEVEISTGANKTRVYFAALPCEAQKLPQIFEDLFQNTRPAARELATSVNLALALKPTRIEISVSDGECSKMLCLEGQAKLRGEVYDAVPSARGTTFQLTRSLGSSLGHLGTQTPEYLAIVKRFRYSPLSLKINGERLRGHEHWGAPRDPGLFSADTITVKQKFWSRSLKVFKKHHALEVRLYHPEPAANCIGLGASRATAQVRLAGHYCPPDNERCYMALGLRVDQKQPSTASFVYEGEILQTFPVRVLLDGVDFAISAHGLSLDLSGESLLQDEAFEARWADAKQLFERVYEAVIRAYGQHHPVVNMLFDPGRISVELATES